ncbi:MAG: prepilin peptidase [Oscillospiraceae bacterium]|nr:prepilin peptidase [Oscillospiraceae bacterium]
MLILEILLLSLVLLLCGAATVTDLQKSIVPNRLFIILLLPCILLNTVYYLHFARAYAAIYAANVLLSILLCFAFYAAHIWGGGDCKLMAFIALLFPARCYFQYGNELFPLIALFILAFSFGYLYLIVHSLICLVRKTETNQHQVTKHTALAFAKQFIASSVYFGFLHNMLSRFLPQFYSDNQTLFLFANIFIALLFSDAAFLRQAWLVALCAAADIILLISARRSIAVWPYAVVAVLLLLRRLISAYNYKTVSITELHPGMILSAASTLILRGNEKNGLPTSLAEDLSCKLTAENIAAIQKWHIRNKKVTQVSIVRKIPFAVFISMGCCLFLILGLVQ